MKNRQSSICSFILNWHSLILDYWQTLFMTNHCTDWTLKSWCKICIKVTQEVSTDVASNVTVMIWCG